MERIKVSDNFYLDEFVHPMLYKRFGAYSRRYVRDERINIVQYLREVSNSPITINNWWDKDWENINGIFINSGTRDYMYPHNIKAILKSAGIASHSQLKGLSFNEILGFAENLLYEEYIESMSRSRHYLAMCDDLKFNCDSKIIHEKYFNGVHLNIMMEMGLTAVEDIECTKGKNGRNGWLHISCENTGKTELDIIKP